MAQNLYLVKSRAFRSYVIAENTDEAWKKFKSWLEEKDYGYYWDRDFQSIEIIASADSNFPKSESGVHYDDKNKTDMLFL